MSQQEEDLHALASQPLRVMFLAHIDPDAATTLSRFAGLLESSLLETMPMPAPEGPASHNVAMTRAAVPDLVALEVHLRDLLAHWGESDGGPTKLRAGVTLALQAVERAIRELEEALS